MTRPTQTPGSTSDAKKRLTLVPTPCCDAAAKVARVETVAHRWGKYDGLYNDAERAEDATGLLEHLRAALDGPAGGGGCA